VVVLAGGKGQSGQDLKTPHWKGQDGFINHTELGWIGFVADKLRTPSVVVNDGVAPTLMECCESKFSGCAGMKTKHSALGPKCARD